MVAQAKIFDLSLPRTGTRTTANALRVLGFTAAHDDRRLQKAFYENGDPAKYPPGSHWDALCHVVHWNPEQLILKYPGSIFLCRQRPLEDWVNSWERARALRVSQGKPIDFSRDHYRQNLFGQTEYDRQVWVNLWVRHSAYITACRDHGWEIHDHQYNWESLCPIVDKPVPNQPFPHIQSESSRTGFKV